MALAIAAVSNADPYSPGIDVTVTGATIGRYLLVTRNVVAGPLVTVRGADYVLNASATFPVSDYEVGLGSLAYAYTAQEALTSGGGTVASATTGVFIPVTVVNPTNNRDSFFFLKDVYQPASSRPVLMSGPLEYNVTGRVTSSQMVLGRKNPVVTTDVNGGRTGSFSFLSAYYTGGLFAGKIDLAQYRTLLESGTPLLLQSRHNVAEIQDMFIMVDGWSYKYYGRPSGAFDVISFGADVLVLEFTVNYVEIDRPATDSGLVSAGTWGDVNTGYASWTAVQSGNATWLEVLNNASP